MRVGEHDRSVFPALRTFPRRPLRRRPLRAVTFTEPPKVCLISVHRPHHQRQERARRQTGAPLTIRTLLLLEACRGRSETVNASGGITTGMSAPPIAGRRTPKHADPATSAQRSIRPARRRRARVRSHARGGRAAFTNCWPGMDRPAADRSELRERDHRPRTRSGRSMPSTIAMLDRPSGRGAGECGEAPSEMSAAAPPPDAVEERHHHGTRFHFTRRAATAPKPRRITTCRARSPGSR